MEKAITTKEGYSYHTDHFVCTSCGISLVSIQYKFCKDPATDKELLSCNHCYKPPQQGNICFVCNNQIIGPSILMKGQHAHPHHYTCFDCGHELRGDNFKEYDGEFYCVMDYDSLMSKICTKCGKPCKDRGTTVHSKLWHVDCFVCHVCKDPLVVGNFHMSNDGIPYCTPHFQELFGVMCFHCNTPVLAGGVKFQGNVFHDDHFRCSSCEKMMKDKEYVVWDNRAICQGCYNRIPKAVKKKAAKAAALAANPNLAGSGKSKKK